MELLHRIVGTAHRGVRSHRNPRALAEGKELLALVVGMGLKLVARDCAARERFSPRFEIRRGEWGDALLGGMLC